MSGSTSRRDFLKATGGVAAATVLAGCDGDDGNAIGERPTGTPADEQRGGTLSLLNATITTLDPVGAEDTASETVVGQCYEGLTTYPDGRSTAEANLATGYETNEDFTEYTFTLQEGVRYHNDGGELTAEDVVYSWERLASSERSQRPYFVLDALAIAARNQNGGPFEGTAEHAYQPWSMDLEATGEYEVTFTQRRAFHATLEMLAYVVFAIHPEGIVGDVEGYDGDVDYEQFATEASYGTGPFGIDAWEAGESARVVAFEDYRDDELPYLDAIEWAIIEAPEPLYRFSTNRNADLLVIPTEYYDPAKVTVDDERADGTAVGSYGPLTSGDASGETVEYYRAPTLETYYVAFDVSNTPRAVRRAVAYVLDRQEVVATTFKDRVPPGYHLTPPTIYPGGAEAYDQHVADAYPYGVGESLLEEARQETEAAGYGPDDRYALTINSVPGIFTEMIRGLRDKLASAHVDVDIEPTDFATIQGRGESGTLQCYTLGYVADWPAPDNFLQLVAPPLTNVSELGQAALTFTHWNELETDAKARAEGAWETISGNLAPTEAATTARQDACEGMEEANWEDVVVLPLVHNFEERFSWEGIHVAPFGPMGSSRQTHDTTWIEDA